MYVYAAFRESVYADWFVKGTCEEGCEADVFQIRDIEPSSRDIV